MSTCRYNSLATGHVYALKCGLIRANKCPQLNLDRFPTTNLCSSPRLLISWVCSFITLCHIYIHTEHNEEGVSYILLRDVPTPNLLQPPVNNRCKLAINLNRQFAYTVGFNPPSFHSSQPIYLYR